jgi:hypothetical protein
MRARGRRSRTTSGFAFTNSPGWRTSIHVWRAGIIPDRFYVDFNPDNKPALDRAKGSLLALDEFGNVKGGIRNTYVDVPVKSFHVPNEGAEPRISNPNHFIAARRINGQDPDAQLCGLGNFETALANEQLKKLYKNPKSYYNKVAQRYDELVNAGWALPVYREMVLAEAGRVRF